VAIEQFAEQHQFAPASSRHSLPALQNVAFQKRHYTTKHRFAGLLVLGVHAKTTIT